MVDWTKRNFITGLILVACAITYGVLKSNSNQDIVDYYKDLEFNGIVVSKFVDSDNGNSRTITVLDSSGSKESIVDNFDRSGLYNHISYGDSIVKNRGDLKIIVSRKGSDSIFELYVESED